MSNYRKHIDNFFKEKLSNYRESPPPEAWGELDARLDGLAPGAGGFQYRWLLHIGIVALLLLLSVSLVRKITGTSQGSGEIAANSASKANATQQATPSTGTTTTGQNTTVAANTATGNNVTSATPNQTPISQAGNNNGQKGNNMPVASNNTYNNKNTGLRKQGTNKPTNTPGAHYTQPGKNPGTSTASDNYNSNNYTRNLSKPAPEEANDNNQLQAASPNTTLSVVTKPQTQANNSKKPVDKTNTSIADKNSNTRIKPSFPRFELGVKAGYEGGFNNEAANKMVVSPYLQYNISRKFAVMTQPGVKLAATPDRTIGAPQTYYDANPEQGILTPGTPNTKTIGGVITYTTVYTYTQPHDSIIKTSRIGGNTMEFEIPILLKYNLTKKLSVYGGVNFAYNKYTTISDNTYAAKGIVRSMTDTVVSINTPPVAPQGLGFTYTGTPIADYQKLNAAHTGYEFSTGYMIGFSYTCSKKWLFDALVEQNPATPDVKAGYNINTPLSSTYFRLSIGYKLK